MERQKAINQYQTEVALYEQYGACSIITFEEWLDIKGIQIDDAKDEIKWMKLIKDNIPNKIEEKELN